MYPETGRQELPQTICLYTTFASLRPALNDLNNQYQGSEHTLAPLEAGELDEGVDWLTSRGPPMKQTVLKAQNVSI